MLQYFESFYVNYDDKFSPATDKFDDTNLPSNLSDI